MSRPAFSASTTTALNAPLTEASGWLSGTSAGYTRAEIRSLPLGVTMRSQIESNLIVQSSAFADARSAEVIVEIPSRYTSAAVTRVWNAIDARIAAFAAAS